MGVVTSLLFLTVLSVKSAIMTRTFPSNHIDQEMSHSMIAAEVGIQQSGLGLRLRRFDKTVIGAVKWILRQDLAFILPGGN